ncbi:leucine-rich repeat-containing G-protein coupled receptor 4-like [Ischnura elegans]|uniref:leucine-rich repeat-containing G-protein coupled receptor 4-like n=1 Tax=Ischnura elegans TaxID=197161 RepID=UPI001ED8AE4F|nr:leucine-rich repeat-containing G-protein coupled receptor 4-like [Ischnura elegans]
MTASQTPATLGRRHGANLLFTMSAILYTILGLTVGTLHCSVRREISPCTCTLSSPSTVRIECEKVASFAQVVEALKGRFTSSSTPGLEVTADGRIGSSPPDAAAVSPGAVVSTPRQALPSTLSLKIAYSNLEDLGDRSFKEFQFGLQDLRLNNNNLTRIGDDTFAGMSGLRFLSLADNQLTEVPKKALNYMPHLVTLDLGWCRLTSISQTDFEGLPELQFLFLGGNSISSIEQGSLPRGLQTLYIGKNQISDLNGSIRSLTNLRWLFMNENNLTTLENQMPPEGPYLFLLHMSGNQLTKLPVELNSYPGLQSLFLQNNKLKSLDGTIKHLKKLQRLHLTDNLLETISSDNFAELESLQHLEAGFNRLTSLNSSLQSLHSLSTLNLTHNLLTEFSLQEIKGLKKLHTVDLSHNLIKKLDGKIEFQNHVETHTRVLELRLEYNQLEELGGVLGGLSTLQKLNLSHNLLQKIAPDDLINLDDLKILDISHNKLTTLEETSKTELPKLEELIANNNLLTTVGPDFYGLPRICKANLQYNLITTIGIELTAKTRCKLHDVAGILRVHFEGNPLVCTDELMSAVTAIEENHTKLYGVPRCFNSTISPE